MNQSPTLNLDQRIIQLLAPPNWSPCPQTMLLAPHMYVQHNIHCCSPRLQFKTNIVFSDYHLFTLSELPVPLCRLDSDNRMAFWSSCNGWSKRAGVLVADDDTIAWFLIAISLHIFGRATRATLPYHLQKCGNRFIFTWDQNGTSIKFELWCKYFC